MSWLENNIVCSMYVYIYPNSLNNKNTKNLKENSYFIFFNNCDVIPPSEIHTREKFLFGISYRILIHTEKEFSN